MEKCSMSPKLLLVSDDEALDDSYRRGQGARSSTGEGCGPRVVSRAQPLQAAAVTHREIGAAVVDD